MAMSFQWENFQFFIVFTAKQLIRIENVKNGVDPAEGRPQRNEHPEANDRSP